MILLFSALLTATLRAGQTPQVPPPSSQPPSSPPSSDVEDEEPNPAADEGEAKGIIPPHGDAIVSTQPVTPITSFPERKLYDQAKEEMQRAQELRKNGDAEAASDMALEAYDDLMSVRTRRRPKKVRAKVRAERHQAATIYVEAGIAYIKGFVQNAGNTAAAREEGRSRLEDLREVARDYPELNRQLNRAIEQYHENPAPAPPLPTPSSSTQKTNK